MLKFAAVVAAGLSMSVAARAADLPNGDASPGLMRSETAYNWSGIYAGAAVGMAWDEVSDKNAAATFGASKANGFIGGLQVGFNKQSGSLVVGLEADFSLSNAHGDNRRTVSGVYGDYTLSGSGNLEAKFANLGTVRVRLGYAIDNVLIFATGGYAFGRHELGLSGAITAKSSKSTQTATDAGSSSNTLSGWALGAGLEYAFARGVSVKAEYLHVHFAPSNFFGDSWAGSDTRAGVNLFRTGVNFRI